MIHYVPICFILAILGTLLANPVFYLELFKKRKKYLKALENFEKNEKAGKHVSPVRKSDYSIFDGSPEVLIIGQTVVFVSTFLFSVFLLYFATATTVRASTILAYLWIPAFSQFANWFFTADSYYSCLSRNISKTFGIIALVLFICSCCVGIHKGVYNYLFPYDDITIMEEKYEECPTVDEITLLEKANLADGSSLRAPIYRNNSWIYPVENNNSHVDSSGYLVVDLPNDSFIFVEKDISYSPWATSTNNTDLIARRTMPSAVFFGSCTFQIEPETGDVYFCKFYGDYASFRAGREVEGAMLINATTGKHECYPLDSIPNWVTGISF